MQVLRLLEKIKRQERGEEEMPPITLPPLPQDERAERLQQLANMKDAAKARKKDDDGFLEFDPSDDAEGFLDEDDDDDEDDESGSDEEFDVVSAYLGSDLALTAPVKIQINMFVNTNYKYKQLCYKKLTSMPRLYSCAKEHFWAHCRIV